MDGYELKKAFLLKNIYAAIFKKCPSSNYCLRVQIEQPMKLHQK